MRQPPSQASVCRNVSETLAHLRGRRMTPRRAPFGEAPMAVLLSDARVGGGRRVVVGAAPSPSASATPVGDSRCDASSGHRAGARRARPDELSHLALAQLSTRPPGPRRRHRRAHPPSLLDDRPRSSSCRHRAIAGASFVEARRSPTFPRSRPGSRPGRQRSARPESLPLLDGLDLSNRADRCCGVGLHAVSPAVEREAELGKRRRRSRTVLRVGSTYPLYVALPTRDPGTSR